MYDNASAQRATEEYQKALAFLENKDYVNASKAAGVMSHYIVDVAVFGHVMGEARHGVQRLTIQIMKIMLPIGPANIIQLSLALTCPLTAP